VLAAYTLCSFAIGAAAGALIRRTIPAMAVTVAGFLAIRIPMEMIRGHLLRPFTVIYPLRDNVMSPRAGRGDWILSSTAIDAAGRMVPLSCHGGSTLGGVRCGLHGTNLRMVDVYQPVSRFWPLQSIETGIVLAIVAALLTLAVWWTIRKIA
jgi:hypothetical protein